MAKKNNVPEWKLERRSLPTLKPYEHNPRIIKGKPFEILKESIDRFGMVQPVTINTDGTIIGGHARYYYLKERGDEWVDCYVPSRTLTEKEVQELNIRLNKNIAGEFDFEVLANFFDTKDLEAWGFESGDFGMPMDDEDEKDVDLPDDDKKPYQQITFTLHNDQHRVVMDALEEVKKQGVQADSINENENGNALYTICKQWVNSL